MTNKILFNTSRPRWRARSIRPFGTSMLVACFAITTNGQLPPNSRLIQIDSGFVDSHPSLNDARTVTFWAGQPGIGEIYVWEAGSLIQLTFDMMLSYGPIVNSRGYIAWLRGLFDQNYDVFMFSEDGVSQITDSPEPEQDVWINDVGGVAWTTVVSYPSN